MENPDPSKIKLCQLLAEARELARIATLALIRTSGVINAAVLDQRRGAYLLGPARHVHRARTR
jgi:hypothetical protein